MRVSALIVVSVTLVLLVVSLVARAEPMLPRDQIPAEATPVVKAAIEDLYSPDAWTRVRAADRLGELGEEALPAVPFLVSLAAEKLSETAEQGGLGRAGRMGRSLWRLPAWADLDAGLRGRGGAPVDRSGGRAGGGRAARR